MNKGVNVLLAIAKELSEGRCEPLGLLDVGQVPTIGDELEDASSEAGDCSLPLDIGEHPVTFP